MQKDVHFYLTYALAMKAGIPDALSRTIAWADQYTDDLTRADLHGIQTQSDILGNWGDKQVQLSVLVPFHFIPGSDKDHPWMTTPNSPRAKSLVAYALKENDPLRVGIALHGLQDTYSHQGFSGWQESLNSCYPWYYLESSLPNIGHAEMRVTPDVLNYVWTDPRNGEKIENWKRGISAARATFDVLVKFNRSRVDASVWRNLKNKLMELFRLKSYDSRVTRLCALSGNDKIDYKDVLSELITRHKVDFIKSANSHLARAMSLFEDLPRVA